MSLMGMVRHFLFGEPKDIPPGIPPDVEEGERRFLSELDRAHRVTDRYRRCPDPFAELARVLRGRNDEH